MVKRRSFKEDVGDLLFLAGTTQSDRRSSLSYCPAESHPARLCYPHIFLALRNPQLHPTTPALLIITMAMSSYTRILTALRDPQLDLPVLCIQEDSQGFDRWIESDSSHLHHNSHSLKQIYLPAKASSLRPRCFSLLLQTLPEIASLRRLDFSLLRWSPKEAHELFLFLSSPTLCSVDCLAFIGGSATSDARVIILDGLKRSACLKQLICVRSNLWDASLLGSDSITLQLKELEIHWPKSRWNLNRPYLHPNAKFYTDSDKQQTISTDDIWAILSGHSALESFSLSSVQIDWEIEGLLQVMLEVNIALKTLRLHDVCLTSSQVRYLVSALGKNNTLEVLDISSNSLEPEAVSNLASVLSASPSSYNQSQAVNTSIRSLILGGGNSKIGRVGAHALAGMVASNTTLINMGIHDDKTLSSDDIIKLFKALECNRNLRTFSLKGCSGVSATVYPNIMDTLRLNRNLERVELSDTPLAQQPEKIKAIGEQLDRNRKQIEVFIKFPRVKPNSARLFLCGHPSAGKSTLWANMAKSLSTKRRCFSLVPIPKKMAPVSRTHGIAVTSIAHQDIRISVWDLAGQLEYQVLHDLMFPINEGPSLFLIICNPVSKSVPYRTSHKRAPPWQNEILYWLQYICSHTRSSEQRYLPRVTLVFTHRDGVSKDEEELRRLERAVNSYREEVRVKFQGSVEIYSGTELHFVDARNMKMANDVAQHVLTVTKGVLDDLPEHVYKVCNDARNALITWCGEHPEQAILSWMDFLRLCRTRVSDLAAAGPRASELTEAVATSLHDSGDIIYLPKTKILIVRPDWFCNKFMGSVIRLEVDEGNHSFAAGNEAFLARDDFERILKKSLMNGGKIQTGVSEKELVDVLFELKLCYETRSSSICNGPLLLIPANLRAPHGPLQWKLERNDRIRPIYVGRRLQCDDPQRTFLTAGFFQAIQVILHGQFVQESHENCISPDSYTLEKHLIYILLSSMEIYVECAGDQGHYIDILVKSYENLDQTLKLLRLKIISHIQEGRPLRGVSLVEGIIQPYYVRHLKSRESRRERCVLIEDLKQEYIRGWSTEGGHLWPANESGVVLYDTFVDLLGPEELSAICEERHAGIQQLAVRLQLHGPQPFSEHESQSQRDIISPMRSLSCSSEGIASCSSVSRSSSERDAMTLLDLRTTVLGLRDDLSGLRIVVDNIDRTVNDVREFREYEMEVVKDIERSLAEMSKYSAQWHEHRVPTNFFVDVPGGYMPGFTTLKLHFLCDRKDGAHVIDRQPGITIHRARHRSLEKILPYMIKVLGLLSLGIKLGVHFVSGMGQIMPDLCNTLAEELLGLGALALDTPDLIDKLLERAEGQLHAVHSGPADWSRDAQEWVFDLLTKNNCLEANAIEETFHLYRIVYPEGGSAWVCKSHKGEGVRF